MTRKLAVVAAVSAVLLALIGQPANANPAPSDRPAPVVPPALAGYPAPVEPESVAATDRSTSTAAVTRRVPNKLLADTLKTRPDGRGTTEPNQSALCQSYLGQPNPYANPAPNVNTIHGDTTVPVGSQTGCQTAQNESTIAVNPFNPLNLVAGANDYRGFNTRENRNDGTGVAYTSMDGGKTWTNHVLPHLTFQTGASGLLSLMDSAGDPVIAFGPHNTVYYANIVFSRLVAANGLAVSVSRDGGLTWGEPSIVQLDGVNPDGTPAPTNVFNDKEWIAADPFSGTVYLTWTKFVGRTESPIMMKKSTDFGRTWGDAVRIAPKLEGFSGGITPFNQGSLPQVANNGTLYVAYEASVCATLACDGFEDHNAIVVATSRDRGRTFKNVEVALDFDFPDNADVGRSTLTGQNFRINSLPQMVYDRFTGRLWLTWADDRNGSYVNGVSVKTNGDSFVVSSRDGEHWSSPLKVGTSADEVFPAVAALAGRVAVSYYTRTYDPNGIGLDYAMSVGWGNGVASAPVRRITTETQNPQVQFIGVGLVSGAELQGTFIGDYTAIAMGLDFKLHPCWTDFRGRPGTNTPNQDIYTQSILAF